MSPLSCTSLLASGDIPVGRVTTRELKTTESAQEALSLGPAPKVQGYYPNHVANWMIGSTWELTLGMSGGTDHVVKR